MKQRIPLKQLVVVYTALERALSILPYDENGIWSDLNKARAIVNTYLMPTEDVEVEVTVEAEDAS